MEMQKDQLLNVMELVLNPEKFELDQLSSWYQDEDEPGYFRAVVQLNSRTTGKSILTWHLDVRLDLEDFYSTYQALHKNDTPKFLTDFTRNKEQMHAFMEMYGFVILPYLKEYNGLIDAYAKIAELVDGTVDQPGAYTRMLGQKFGI